MDSSCLELRVPFSSPQQELEERLALIPPADTVRGILLNSVLRAVREVGDEALVKRCLEVTGEETLFAFFSYPASMMVRLLYVAAGELSDSQGGVTAALRSLGGAMSPDFLGSVTGRALMLLSGTSVKRMLSTMPSAFAATINHGSCGVEWMGQSGGRLVIKGNAVPCAYFEGSLRRTLDMMQKRGVRVVGRQLGLLEC
ncbi:MAG: TIGR02265 family protein, partial [Archangium sp.]